MLRLQALVSSARRRSTGKSAASGSETSAMQSVLVKEGKYCRRIRARLDDQGRQVPYKGMRFS